MSSERNSESLSIVMPAYNEAGCIAEVIEDWLSKLKQLDLFQVKLVVVNDGSRDETGVILDELAKARPELKVIHQANAGHGVALLKAYHIALEDSPTWIFQVDSDNQFFRDDLDLLWRERSNANFILGYRKIRYDALHRLVITRILRLFNLIFFGAYIPDANIPFRLIRGRYLKTLLAALPGPVFAPNIFLAVMATRDGQDLKHIPVRHQDRTTGTVSIVRWRLIKICFRCVRELCEFRLNLGTSLAKIRAGYVSAE